MTISLQTWLLCHPFLEPIARLEATVDELLEARPRTAFVVPAFDQHKTDFESGIALLRSPPLANALLAPSAGSFEALAWALSKASIPASLAEKARELYDYLHQAPERSLQAVNSIVTQDKDASKLPHLGTARYIAWRALAYELVPTFAAFNTWREKAAWLYGYCPTCGAKPLLSRLTEQGDGKQRSLVCSLCATHWKVRRLGCPHCGNEEEESLEIFELEEQPELRLEVCNLCRGYLKTWVGELASAPFFSDWSTLHLDAMAAERHYVRLGASLYET
jgi:FdhE protein